MIRAILVDDELIALEVLEILLKRNGDYEIVAKFSSPTEALVQIERLKPDVVFLDMEMGHLNGLDVAEQLLHKNLTLEVVFVTAYSKYALEAFEVNAMDYLLKPVQEDRLEKTTERLKRRQETCGETMQMVEAEVQVFSSVNVVDRTGNYVKWRTKKVRELFAYLWHFKNQLISKDVLVEALWPEASPEKSMPLLHTTVYQLRKVLPSPDLVEHLSESYVMHLDWPSDYDKLDAILNKTAVTLEDIQTLLDLYKEGYMAQEGYAWSITLRSRLEQQVIEILERFMENTPPDQWNLVIIDRLLNFNPYCERYAEWMMTYLEIFGNPSKVQQFYKMFSNRLQDELGLEPSLDLSHKCNNYM